MSRAMTLLIVLCIVLVGFTGCRNARDSGSTVTGRALRFPLGTGIPFIRVLVNGENALRLQVTESSGTFVMYHVPVGVYTVTFARFGVKLWSTELAITESDCTFDSARAIFVELPQLDAGVNDLSGTVEDQQNIIADAEVWAIYADGGVAYATSNESGEYRFENLPDGSTTIVATAPNHQMRVVKDVTIGFEGVTKLDIDMDVIPDFEWGSMIGFVKNADGDVLKDSYVGIFPESTVPSLYMVAQEETLSGQGYLVNHIPPGTYTVICTHSGYALKTALVVVQANQTTGVNFVLDSDDYRWRSSEHSGP